MVVFLAPIVVEILFMKLQRSGDFIKRLQRIAGIAPENKACFFEPLRD